MEEDEEEEEGNFPKEETQQHNFEETENDENSFSFFGKAENSILGILSQSPIFFPLTKISIFRNIGNFLLRKILSRKKKF